MSIAPINIPKIGFKGNVIQTSPKSDTNTAPSNDEANTGIAVNSNPIASELNVKTPISYKKIAELKISGTEDKAQLYKLANGQKIVILSKKGPAVVRTYFNVGSMNEPDNLRGISHYIEHNLFNGSKNLAPGEFFQQISKLGAYTNAMTGYNQTSYFVQSNLLEDNYLEDIVKLHADQVQNPTFAQEQLTKEKGPVTSEISMYADNPSNVGRNLALKNLFNIKSASQDVIAGTIQNINSITKKDVVDYYNTWYTPDNSLTVISADVPAEKAIELASKYFTKNTLSNSETKKYEELTPTNKPVRTDIKKPNAQAANINIGFIGPANNDTKGKIATEVLSMILTGYKNARITKALEPYQVDAGLSLEKIGNKTDDKNAIFIESTTPEEKSETTIKVIYNEIAKLAQNPPTQEELNIVRDKLKMDLAERSESSLLTNEFIGTALLDNDQNMLGNYKEIVDSLTPQDLKEAAQKYLDLNKVSISVVHPEKTSDEQIIANYKNTNSPAKPKAAASVSFGNSPIDTMQNLYSNVKEYKLKNNMEVVINPTKSDFTSYQIDLDVKSSLNLSSAELLILSEMLNRGSQNKDNSTFHDILDKSNIEMGFDASSTGISIGCKSPENKLSQALALSKEVILNPRFTQEDFDWAKQNVKDGLSSLSKDANDKLDATLYPNLPYMQTVEETLKKLDSVSLENIMAVYKKIMEQAQGQAVLSAPTDKNPDLMNQFVSSLSNDIPVLKEFNAAPINTYENPQTSQILTATEQRLQAQIVQGYKFKNTGNIDDEAKLSILNTILGGTSTSRLFQDLRESQKLAYYVSSKYGSHGDTSIIKLNILTTTDDCNDASSSPLNVKKSIDGFEKHINKLKTELVSEEELQKAKLTLKNSILSSTETSILKTQDLASGKSSYYGINQSKKLLEAIEKVTLQDVKNAANYAFASSPITSIVASQKTLEANNL